MPEFAVTVSQETTLFLGSCLLGIPLGLLLDLFRTLRVLLPHHAIAVFFEDALLGLGGCVILQLYASAFAQDSLRWYFALGMLLGLALWLLTVGLVWMRVIRALRTLLRRIGTGFCRIVQCIGRLFVRSAENHEAAKKIDETP